MSLGGGITSPASLLEISRLGIEADLAFFPCCLSGKCGSNVLSSFFSPLRLLIATSDVFIMGISCATALSVVSALSVQDEDSSLVVFVDYLMTIFDTSSLLLSFCIESSPS